MGAMISNIGTWMETTALSYYVADTSENTWSAVVAAAGFIPTAFLSPVGGAWADRFDRRKVLIMSNATSCVIAAAVALTVQTGHATPLLLAGFSLLGGCVFAVGFPSFQATLPDLVPKEELVAAIGLASTQWNLGRILGPAVAAGAIWLGGVSTALWINAASFLCVIAAISAAHIPKSARTKRMVREATRDAIHFGRTNPAVRAMVPLMVTVAFIGAPFIGFVAQMATKVFGSAQGGTSLLIVAQGVGAVAAGASMGHLTHMFGLRNVTIGWMMALGPALVLYGASPHLWISAVALAMCGGCYMGCLSSFSSITQQSAPDALRGRALIINNFVLGFGYPLGLMIQGPLADSTSLRTVTMGSGVAIFGVLLARRVLQQGFTDPIATALG
jgi:MFS family permease